MTLTAKQFLEKFKEASNLINDANRKGAANHMIVGTEAYRIIELQKKRLERKKKIKKYLDNL